MTEAGTPSTDERPARPALRRPLPSLFSGAAWLLGLRAALLIVTGFLGNSPLAEAVVGALVVDLSVSRAGIAWTSEETALSTLRRRVAGAATLALATVLTIAALGRAFGLAEVRGGHLDFVFFLSLLGVFAAAIRDELLLRAVPMHFGATWLAAAFPGAAQETLRARWRWGLCVFAALLSATPVFFEATPAALALAVGSGFLFARIYDQLGGAWSAIGAHAAWSLTIGPLLRGGLVELVPKAGELSEAPTASGPLPWLAAGAAVLAALLVVPRLARATPGEAEAAPAST